MIPGESQNPVRPLELLRSASTALSDASRCISSGTPVSLEACQPFLESVQTALNRLHSETQEYPPEQKKELASEAQELRDSLKVFAAMAMQSKAYFDSLEVENLQGQIAYGRSSSKAVVGREVEKPILEL